MALPEASAQRRGTTCEYVPKVDLCLLLLRWAGSGDWDSAFLLRRIHQRHPAALSAQRGTDCALERTALGVQRAAGTICRRTSARRSAWIWVGRHPQRSRSRFSRKSKWRGIRVVQIHGAKND
jgi:hypothetical protein